MMAVIWTIIGSLKHQLTMSREIPEDKHYKLCVLFIDTFTQYAKTKDIPFYNFIKHYLQKKLTEQLYSSDYKVGNASIYYLKELVEDVEYKELIVDNTSNLLIALFVFLNKLPSKFNFEIQSTCVELCRKIVRWFIQRHVSKGTYFEELSNLVDRLIPLIETNENQQQKFLLTILNILFGKFEDKHEKNLYELLLRKEYNEDSSVGLDELLANPESQQKNSPFYRVMNFVHRMIVNYSYLMEKRNDLPGSFKQFTGENCNQLSNMILVLSQFIKLKIKLKIFDGNRFEKSIDTILRGMLLIIKENEEFNEKKMESRGYGVIKNLSDMQPTQPEHPLNPRRTGQFQPYIANPNIYYQDIENDIHVDDHDFYIKDWSILVENVVMFFANFLTIGKVHERVKQGQEAYKRNVEINKSANRSQPSDPYPNDILRTRDQIIIKMFELLPRVENRIRSSVDIGFKYLLNSEAHIKEIMHEDKLVFCFRPLLSCLQLQDLQNINQNTLYSFIKLFKLFHSCFNKGKLSEKLIEYLNTFKENLKNQTQTKTQTIPHSNYQLINLVFILFIKLINNDELNKIMELGLEIERHLQNGMVHNFSLKPVLRQVINQQSSSKVINFLKDNIMKPSPVCFEFLLETLKQDQSHPFRERVSREELTVILNQRTADVESQLSNPAEDEKKLYRWTKLVRILSRKIPTWLQTKYQIIEFYTKRLAEMKHKIINAKEFDNSELLLKDHFIITLKIIVEYCTYHRTDTNLVFTLLEMANLRINQDLGFLQKFFKETIPKKYDFTTQREILSRFLNNLEEKRKEDCQDQVRLGSHLLVLPILKNAFEGGQDHMILTQDLIQNLRKKIDFFYKEESSQYEPWVLVELSLIIDFILTKTNLRTQETDQTEFNRLLDDVLMFTWKNITRENPLLKNLSKLVVARLISRFEKLKEPNKIGYIHQLYLSVICDTDQTSADENKNIWLRTCNLLLPEVKKLNLSFVENSERRSEYWIEKFIPSLDPSYQFSQFNREISLTYTRFWQAILQNRELVEEHRIYLTETKFGMFSNFLRLLLQTGKQPLISLDILLLFITWYIKEHNKRMALQGQTAKATESATPAPPILGMNSKKEEHFLTLLLQALVRDESHCSTFMNMSYYLLRKYMLAFPKASYDLSIILGLLKSKKSQQTSQLPSVGQNRLRMNFVVMNLSLAFLYHPIPEDPRLTAEYRSAQQVVPDGGDQTNQGILISAIKSYMYQELQQKESKKFVKFPYLIPLSYQIMKKIYLLSNSEQREKLLIEICQQAGNSVNIVVQSQRDKDQNQTQAGEFLSLWVAILQFKLIYEIKPDLLIEYLSPLFELIQIFIDYISKNQKREDEGDVEFSLDKDILDKYFYCDNLDILTESNHNSKTYYKGYTIIILRILIYHFGYTCRIKNKSVMAIFTQIFQKVGYSDYDLKIEALMLVKCIVLPNLVSSPVYRKISENLRSNSDEWKIKIFLKLDPENFFTSKEIDNKGYKVFINIFWDMMLEFLDTYQNSQAVNECLRITTLVANSGVEIINKQRLYEKINKFGEFGVFAKFLLLANHEFTKTPSYYQFKTCQMVKNLTLLTMSEFKSEADVSSGVYSLIQNNLDRLSREEEDYLLSEQRLAELTKDVDVKTRKGKVIKTKKELVFSDLSEEIKYRITGYKNYLRKFQGESFFNSFGELVELDNYSEEQTVQVFWVSYFKQLWNQSSAVEKEKIWTYLQDLAHFPGNSEEDYATLLITLKELRFPFMMPEQMKILAKKIMNPQVPLALLEELATNFHMNFLSSNRAKIKETLQLQQIDSHFSVSLDSLFMGIADQLQELSEEDMKYGLMISQLNLQGFRSKFQDMCVDQESTGRANSSREIPIIDEFDMAKQELVHAVQNRRWLKAEELSEAIIQDMEFVDKENCGLSSYIDKYIVEKCWVDVQKNMNEWQKLHELSVKTDRRDLLLESAYFLQKPKLIEQIYYSTNQVDNPLSCVYLMSVRLMDAQYQEEVLDKTISKNFKELIYINMINEWYILPRVFSEKHKSQLALSHLCLDFEEGWDLIQMVKKYGELKDLPKIKDEILYMNLICRERIPHSSMGILECKKILEQRSLISHVLTSRMTEIIQQRAQSLVAHGIGHDEHKKTNIFNETHHNAVKYCEIERKFEVYNTIFNISKLLDQAALSESFSTQNDEFLYLKEKLKLWAVDPSQESVPVQIENRLCDDNFNKDLRSDLRSKIMWGFLMKRDLEQANRNGVESIKLHEENPKAWKIWFHFYKQICDQTSDFSHFATSLIEMVKCFRKLYRNKPHKSMMLLGEIIRLIAENDAFEDPENAEAVSQVMGEMNTVLYKVEIWIWVAWLPNMLLQFVRQRVVSKFDQFAYNAVSIASKVYPEFTQKVLGVLGVLDPKTKEYQDINNYLANCNLNLSKNHEVFRDGIKSVWDELKLEEVNDVIDMFDQVYSKHAIDSGTISDIQSRCKDLKKKIPVSQYKNQDVRQKFQILLGAFDEYVQQQQRTKCGSVNQRLDLAQLPVCYKIALNQPFCYYEERSIRHCVKSHYLVPNINVIYEGSRFKLELEFSSEKFRSVKYVFEKRLTDSPGHLLKSHYQKLLNTQLLKDPETVYRDLKFVGEEFIFFEEDFFMRKKSKMECYLADLLERDTKLKNKPLELMIEKLSVEAINAQMRESVSPSILEKCVLQSLVDKYDIFYWRKAFGQSLALNAVSDLLFGNQTDFCSQLICFKHGQIVSDNTQLTLPTVQPSTSSPSDALNRELCPQLPLRLTQNTSYLLKDYMVQGVVLPAMSALLSALRKFNQDYDHETIFNLFIRDVMSYQKRDSPDANEDVSRVLEKYFTRVLDLGENYLAKNASESSSLGQNPDILSSMKTFIDTMMDEDYQNKLSLSHRVFF